MGDTGKDKDIDEPKNVKRATSAPMWQAASSFGWVDVDRDQAKQVRDLLGLFKAPEALDPHGILPLQIALSDR